MKHDCAVQAAMMPPNSVLQSEVIATALSLIKTEYKVITRSITKNRQYPCEPSERQ